MISASLELPISVSTPTVDLDPNNLDARNTGFHVALFAEADQPIRERMLVLARQRADVDGDVDWVGLATVVEVNEELGIFYLDVDWNSFRDVSPAVTGGAESVVSNGLSKRESVTAEAFPS